MQFLKALDENYFERELSLDYLVYVSPLSNMRGAMPCNNCLIMMHCSGTSDVIDRLATKNLCNVCRTLLCIAPKGTSRCMSQCFISASKNAVSYYL